MENINFLLSTALDKYFTILKSTGYVNKQNVDNLIVLSGISYILSNFQDYITEEHIRNISRALLCISGNCLIDYNIELSEESLIKEIKQNLAARISEDEIFRFSTENVLRIKQ